jgi:hypothetical protein
MADAYPPVRQRPVGVFAEALGSALKALRRQGKCARRKLGSINAVLGRLDESGRQGFQLYCDPSLWKRQGRRARIARPPRELGSSDLLISRRSRFKESAS